MKKRNMILSLIMSLAFAACSAQDNNGNTHIAENIEKVPAAQAYDGYEELLGKDFEIIVMPEKIEKPAYEKVYTFRHRDTDIPDGKAYAENAVKSITGESYDEKYLSGPDGSASYLYSAPDILITVQYGTIMYVDRSANSLLHYESDLLGVYSASDRNKTLELEGGNCTVGELLDSMQTCIDKDLMIYHNGFKAFPVTVRNLKNPRGRAYANIEYCISYKGVTLEDSSPLFITEDGPGYEIITFYIPNSLTLVTASKEGYQILTPTFSAFDPDVREIPDIISLKSAVNILKNELAPYMRQKIDSVELRYCCLHTAPERYPDEAKNSSVLADYGEIKTAWYEPVWCFYYTKKDGNETREAFKINAVTGEITVDNSEGKKY